MSERADDPTTRLKTYAYSAWGEYVRVAHRRALVQTIGENEATLRRSVGKEFFFFVSHASNTEINLALARAFDPDSRTTSIRSALKYIKGARADVLQAGVEVSLARRTLARYQDAGGIDDPASALDALVNCVSSRVADVDPILKALKTRRNKMIAHSDLELPPRDGLKNRDISKVQAVLAVAIDCLVPFISQQVTHNLVNDGEVVISNSDEPVRALRCLISDMAASRQERLPDGYSLEMPHPGVWRVRATRGQILDVDRDVDALVVKAWRHMVDSLNA